MRKWYLMPRMLKDVIFVGSAGECELAFWTNDHHPQDFTGVSRSGAISAYDCYDLPDAAALLVGAL